MKKTLFKDDSLEVYLDGKNTLKYIYKGHLKRQNLHLKEGSYQVNKKSWFTYGVLFAKDNPAKAEMVYLEIINPDLGSEYGKIIPILDDHITKKTLFEMIGSLSWICRTLNFGLYSTYNKKQVK